MNQSINLPIEWIERIFMRLHGRFGNVFFDKFRTGILNEYGLDIGVENAKHVWSEELAGMTPERIKTALQANYEYPPSCDDFKKHCKISLIPHETTKISAPINKEANREKSKKLSMKIVEISRQVRDRKEWAHKLVDNENQGAFVPEISLRKALEVLGMKQHGSS